MNLYAYVGNDPINFIDPLGLQDVVDGPEIVVTATRVGCPATDNCFDDPYGQPAFGGTRGANLGGTGEPRENNARIRRIPLEPDEIVVTAAAPVRPIEFNIWFNEFQGAHIIKLHVFQNLLTLGSRRNADRKRYTAFFSIDDAEDVIEDVLNLPEFAGSIEGVINGSLQEATLVAGATAPVGFDQYGNYAYSVRAIIRPSPAGYGFYVHTAYPWDPPG